jgi:hypothetical protein
MHKNMTMISTLEGSDLGSGQHEPSSEHVHDPHEHSGYLV